MGYAMVAPWKQKAAYRYTVENSIYLRAAATGITHLEPAAN